MDTPQKTDKKTTADIMDEIQQVIGTIDGIATADVFKLAGLIKEYGQATAGEAASAIMKPLFDTLLKPRKDVDEPWKEGR